MYAARWLLAPPYLGLSLGLVLLGSKLFEEVIHVLPLILDMSEADLVLVILGLIDIAPSFLLVLIIYHLFLILRNSGTPGRLRARVKKTSYANFRHGGSLPNKAAVDALIAQDTCVKRMALLMCVNAISKAKPRLFRVSCGCVSQGEEQE